MRFWLTDEGIRKYEAEMRGNSKALKVQVDEPTGRSYIDVDYDPLEPLTHLPRSPRPQYVEAVSWREVIFAGFRPDAHYKDVAETARLRVKTLEGRNSQLLTAVGSNLTAVINVIIGVRTGVIEPAVDFTAGCDDTKFLGRKDEIATAQ